MTEADDDDAIAPTLAAFASRPEGDVLARAVSKARIENLMFESAERVTLGRYHLVSRLGAGGMGTVWGAFDPELDRKVAIKLLKEELAADRERIVVEGKSLAKLAHPNVVTVHDVGVVDEQVYIVMEWIHGKTLREYVRDATPRDIIAAYRAAGEGLAAAHAVGLVHRDFKPDNAMVGDDTRVRVLDFGLARDEPHPDAAGGDTVTRGAGTPRYMAPEQAAGGELSPAADQFAFCVSLRESLDVRVPKWIQQIITRGTAPVPAERFPSMRALLDALAKDPAVIWRRRLLAGGAVAVAGAAFAIGSLQASDDVERCTGSAEEIAKVWNPRRAAELRSHLEALGPYGATEATRLAPILDDHRENWAIAHRTACLARDRGELTPQVYELHLACLARTQAAFGAIIEVLATAEKKKLSDASSAVSVLPAPETCRSYAETSTVIPPPAAIAARVSEVGADVERARTRALAFTADSITFAKATAARAAELGYLPLIARADLEVGRAQWKHGDDEQFASLPRALHEGLEAGDSSVAVEAYAMELRALVVAAKPPENLAERLALLPTIESLAKGLGSHAGSARALLYNVIGNRFMSNGDTSRARAMFERALDESPEPMQQAQLTQNRAGAIDDPIVAEKLSNEAIALLVSEIGPDHPETLYARITGAMLLRSAERGLAALREPCDRMSELHPHFKAQLLRCWFERGSLAEELGRADEARAAMSSVPTTRDDRRDLADGYLLFLDGKHADAARRMVGIADSLVHEPKSYKRERAAVAFLVAAQSQLALDQGTAAIVSLTRAEETLVGITDMNHVVHYQRYLARVRATLARLTIGTEPEKARQRARQAARWYRGAGQPALAVELESLGN